MASCASGADGASSTATTTTDHAIAAQEGLEQPPPHLSRLGSKFCRMCGSPMHLRVPAGEKEWRHVCSNETTCGAIEYFNPKMVVGCIVEHEGKVLLCRRAIEPCRGLWTVPAGYMELRESSAEGAARETREEANAEVSDLVPYAHWDIPSIGQAYILFRGHLAAPFTFSPGVESLETGLFAPADIPFDELAFSSVSITLKYFLEDVASGRYRVHHGVIQKEPGAASNDPATFAVRDHNAMFVSAS